MGWTLSISSAKFGPNKNTGVALSTRIAGAHWSFTSNIHKTATEPAWQAQRICQQVLSTLATPLSE